MAIRPEDTLVSEDPSLVPGIADRLEGLIDDRLARLGLGESGMAIDVAMAAVSIPRNVRPATVAAELADRYWLVGWHVKVEGSWLSLDRPLKKAERPATDVSTRPYAHGWTDAKEVRPDLPLADLRVVAQAKLRAYIDNPNTEPGHVLGAIDTAARAGLL